MSTHDTQNQAFLEPYTPAPHEVPATHWSTSKEYAAYRAARERATLRLNMAASLYSGQAVVNENDSEVKATYAAFM